LRKTAHRSEDIVADDGEQNDELGGQQPTMPSAFSGERYP
jgi:hypothetical protein